MMFVLLKAFFMLCFMFINVLLLVLCAQLALMALLTPLVLLPAALSEHEICLVSLFWSFIAPYHWSSNPGGYLPIYHFGMIVLNVEDSLVPF